MTRHKEISKSLSINQSNQNFKRG